MADAGLLGAETLKDEPPERVVVERGAGAARHVRLGLEPRLADDDTDRLRGIELPSREQADQDGKGRDARGPRPDTLGARELALGGQDLRVLRVAREPLALAQEAEHPVALLAGVAGGEPLRHGVADLEGHDRRPLAERPRDRVRPRRLGRDQAPRVADPASHLTLAK